MSPLRSSLAKTVGKLLGVYRNTDLSLRTTVKSKHVVPNFSATGGNQNTAGGDAPGNGYKYHVFTSSGSLVCTGSPKNIEFLVVAGGGGGGYGNGGGAGAGGLRTNDPNVPSGIKVTSTVTLAAGTYPITVGNGGQSHPEPYSARKGEPSSIGSLVIATGGGGGGPVSPSEQNPNMDGGSGGGSEPYAGQTVASPDGLTVTKQGNNGGTANGGGGGGGAGGNASSATGGSKLSCPAYSSPIINPICPMPGAWQSYVGSGGAYAGGGYGYPNRSSSHNGGEPYAGIVNTGGGADSNDGDVFGGKGIVIIRYTE
tara:strand:- start:289 stop:1224 length:936 start_codon:yes stop_codon:yes gene_type:complete